MEKHIFDVKRKMSCLKLTLDETKNDMHVEFTYKGFISLQGLDELRFFPSILNKLLNFDCKVYKV